MRVFVTGGTGYIGSALIPELVAAGHTVLGLARSEEAGDTLRGLGAEAHRGDLGDISSLREGAQASDAVVHLAYNHDFSQMSSAGEVDRAALSAFAEEYAGTSRPIVGASGILGLPRDREVTEVDVHEAYDWLPPRDRAERLSKQFAETHGVMSSVVRLAPTVHGTSDWGFITTYVQTARDRGTAAYVGDGTQTWPAVHRSDAATLFRLAIEKPVAGEVLHGTAENVAMRDLADAVATKLGVSVSSIPAERATDHFGAVGHFFTLSAVASNAWTRARFGWEPSGPSLLQDIASGAYTD